VIVSSSVVGGALRAGDTEPAKQPSLEIHLVLKGPAIAPLRGTVKLRPTDGKGESQALPLSSQSMTVVLPPHTSWELVVEIPGFWCRRARLSVGGPDWRLMQPVEVWPVGRISGWVATASPPKDVIVETLPPQTPAAKNGLKGAMRCPTNAQGMWSCAGWAASTFDLLIRVPGFAPEYRWAVRVPPGGEVDLGRLALNSGGSLAGWVQLADGSKISDRCWASLTQIEGSAGAEPQLSASHRVKVGADGFFQVTGVGTGRYALAIEQPGYLPARLPSISFQKEDAARLLEEPLTLHRVDADVTRPNNLPQDTNQLNSLPAAERAAVVTRIRGELVVLQ
jgi:hypothetical protein